MNKIFSILLIFLLLPVTADSSTIKTGEDLLYSCKRAISYNNGAKLMLRDQVRMFSCLSYVNGFFDGWQAKETTISTSDELSKQDKKNIQKVKNFCLSGKTIMQLVRVIVRALEKNPKILNYKSNLLVTWILTKSFPCKK
ncbi:MAG TPA: hypothetical protein ENH23_05140 [candidate division Zixibacteria bacterium]|nr:hypothetical protein [candidate division Zixibacteria bacterium]